MSLHALPRCSYLDREREEPRALSPIDKYIMNSAHHSLRLQLLSHWEYWIDGNARVKKKKGGDQDRGLTPRISSVFLG